MIDKKAFAELRKQVECYDSLREHVIKTSRDALKLSKGAIYSMHRAEVNTAKKQLAEAKKILDMLKNECVKEPTLLITGTYSEALEEHTEAQCYYYYLTEKRIPSANELGMDAETYLAGLCDTVGELVRKAVNSVIQGDTKTALEIKEVVTAIYEELMLFDFRNTSVRRKFDSIKYSLEKLEDLALQVKMKHG
ncbi:MAG: hypothetical protein Q7K43_01270 [Candidatus Woesearchaeota archaeon]|nr:hypothetical protein [Candidatus Woesearchaeota archaeon]